MSDMNRMSVAVYGPSALSARARAMPASAPVSGRCRAALLQATSVASTQSAIPCESRLATVGTMVHMVIEFRSLDAKTGDGLQNSNARPVRRDWDDLLAAAFLSIR